MTTDEVKPPKEQKRRLEGAKPAPVQRRDLPDGLVVGDWFVNHDRKRVIGRAVRLFPKQSAVAVENQLGVRVIYQASFLLNNGYVVAKDVEPLKADGYTNTIDIKRQWQDPKPPAEMTEEAKERLRELSRKKKADKDERAATLAEDTTPPDAKPKPPRPPTDKSAKECLCGCHGTTKSFFQPGHDVKFKKKVFNAPADLTPPQLEYALRASWVTDSQKAELRKLVPT